MSALDTWIIYKFIRLLATPFDETDAFRLGIINSQGKFLREPKNAKEKDAYTLFHRLVFNIKRLIEKIPGGKTKIGTYAAALFLLREQLVSSDSKVILEKNFMTYLKEQDAVTMNYLQEQYCLEEMLDKGEYLLKNTMLDISGNLLEKNTLVVSENVLKPYGRVLGVDVYKLMVESTGKFVIVSREDINESI